MSPRPVVYDDALRARLVRCTAAAVAESGYDGVNVRKVAAMAGTSTSAIYSLFGSKEELFREVITATINSFFGSQLAVPATDDPVEDLKNLGRDYRTWALANPDMYELMFGSQIIDPAFAATDFSGPEAGVQPLMAALERGFAAGIFSPHNTAGEIALLMWTFVHGFVSLEAAQWSAIPEADRDRLFELSLEAQGAHWRSPA